jgi:hypothetical protein
MMTDKKCKPKPKAFLVLLLVAAMMAGCQSGNLTTLADKEVFARTTTANQARMTPEGNLTANYQGIGATQAMTEPNAIWTQMQGPACVTTFPMPLGTVQVISPKDIICKGLKYTPVPAKGEAMLEIAEFSANISVPMSQDVAALVTALPQLAGMTQTEANARVAEWVEAGKMLPTVAEVLKAIIAAAFPPAAVIPVK